MPSTVDMARNALLDLLRCALLPDPPAYTRAGWVDEMRAVMDGPVDPYARLPYRPWLELERAAPKTRAELDADGWGGY